MPTQYLVAVKDKANIDFLRECGEVEHITKLRNLIVLKAKKENIQHLFGHKEIVYIVEARTLSIKC